MPERRLANLLGLVSTWPAWNTSISARRSAARHQRRCRPGTTPIATPRFGPLTHFQRDLFVTGLRHALLLDGIALFAAAALAATLFAPANLGTHQRSQD
jgi:hypothetical protein